MKRNKKRSVEPGRKVNLSPEMKLHNMLYRCSELVSEMNCLLTDTRELTGFVPFASVLRRTFPAFVRALDFAHCYPSTNPAHALHYAEECVKAFKGCNNCRLRELHREIATLIAPEVACVLRSSPTDYTLPARDVLFLSHKALAMGVDMGGK